MRSDVDKFMVGDPFDLFGDDIYLGHSINTMIEEMSGGGMYDVLGEQEDDYRSSERTGTDDDGYYQVSQSSRYF